MVKHVFKVDELISVYTDLQSDCFGVGYVGAIDNDFVALYSIDPLGNDDGVTLYRYCEIIKIEKNSKYLLKVKALNEAIACKQEKFQLPNSNLIFWVLKSSEKEKALIEIQLLESGQRDIIGFVKELSEQICTVSMVDEYGNIDGEVVFETDMISSVKYNSLECRNIKTTYKTK